MTPKILLFLFVLSSQGEIAKTNIVGEFTSMEQCITALQRMPVYPNTILACIGEGNAPE